MDASNRTWAMILHFSQFAGYAVPFAGFLAPIVIWQLKKDESPELDLHGRIVANWMLSNLIYAFVCALLAIFGIGILGLIVFGVLGVLFPIIGGIKANSGEAWRYPLSIRFF